MSVHYAPTEPDGRMGPTLCRTKRYAMDQTDRTSRPAEVTCGRCLRSLRLRPWVQRMLDAETAPGPAGPGARETPCAPEPVAPNPSAEESTANPEGLASP